MALPFPVLGMCWHPGPADHRPIHGRMPQVPSSRQTQAFSRLLGVYSFQNVPKSGEEAPGTIHGGFWNLFACEPAWPPYNSCCTWTQVISCHFMLASVWVLDIQWVCLCSWGQLYRDEALTGSFAHSCVGSASPPPVIQGQGPCLL